MCEACASLKTFSADCVLGDESARGQTDTTYADLLATSGTNATVTVGGSYVGELETAGDSDWIAVNLVAGQSYTISLSGYGSTPVSDTYLRLFAPGSDDRATGTQVAYDDDGGAGYYSSLVYTATTTGTFYIDAASYADYYSGGYIVEVSGYEAPDNTEVWTTQQIADQLTRGYWGGTQRSFNVGSDNAITYNLSALDATYAGFARQALQTWSDVIGVQFIETTGSGEITFTQNGSMEAWSSSSRSGTTITGSTVNIASNWLTSQGTPYTQQTFIHEIGHALGLGHAGNYNGSASYGTDNLYANDSWQATVMSYFSQTQNTTINANKAYLLTPMLADIIAIRDLYGTQGTTRTGDTVYGYNNNTGSSNFGANVLNDTGTNYALTIVDDGGTDTIDMSGSSKTNRIDLTPGSISDTGGLIGNLTIGPNTIIENAFGGSGNDTIIGNDANNLIGGGAGNDTLRGGNGDDVLGGDAGADVLDGGEGSDWASYNDASAGVTADLQTPANNTGDAAGDTYISIENLEGSDHNDHLYGDAQSNMIWGRDGNDVLSGRGGIDYLDGGAGTDVAAYDVVASAADVARFANVTFVFQSAGDRDQLTSIETLRFSDGDIALADVPVADPYSYLASYSDLLAVFGANTDSALWHYFTYGHDEGRSLDLFDEYEFLASNTDLIGLDPSQAAQYYVETGAAEGRTIGSFDGYTFIASNTDLIGMDVASAAQYYVETGYDEGLSLSSFDAYSYLAGYGDLLAAFGTNTETATWHYVTYGYAEGRAADTFDEFSYLASNTDLIDLFGADGALAAQHYVESGFGEGRATDTFDEWMYLASNEDLLDTLGSNGAAATEHYVETGYGAGLATNSFDAAQYLANYGDLQAAFGDNLTAAAWHYVMWGHDEGRSADLLVA